MTANVIVIADLQGTRAAQPAFGPSLLALLPLGLLLPTGPSLFVRLSCPGGAAVGRWVQE